MKKSLLTVIAILCVGLFSSAVAQQSKFVFGINGGPNFTSLLYTKKFSVTDEKFVPEINFTGGLSVQFMLQKNFSLISGFAFERKGQIFKETYHDGNAIVNFRERVDLNYFNLPIMCRKTFGKTINYFIDGGIYLGYIIKASSIGVDSDGNSYKSDISQYYKNFDSGIALGIGLSIPIKEKVSLSFEIRNYSGLLNIGATPVENDSKILNNSTNLLLGITYKLGSI
jgi:hypothetical protein